MEKLTEKKRKWIISEFRAGRSATQVAQIQKISRRMVYKLAHKYLEEGTFAFRALRAGRPRTKINPSFIKQVIRLREECDYGSEKIHFKLKREGFKVSQHIIQRVLDEEKLTEPCQKRRGQRVYVRYQWPISNYMWHIDWTQYSMSWYCSYIDDRSRRIMAAGKFASPTTKASLFVLYQAMLGNGVCPVVVLSDKGGQFYANKYTKKGKKGVSEYEKALGELGIELWTSRRNHPQTNGKVEKWFDTLKKRMKKHPKESLQEFVLWYNEGRIHHALSYETPDSVYKRSL